MKIYHSDGKFKGVGGLDLYYQSWIPDIKVRGVLAVVHGLGGHSGRYSNIVEHLLPKQYAIYGVDMRGHGRSPGQRGYINAWAEYREDLRSLFKLIHQQQPEVPVFLLGHSMGGVIVLDYALRYAKDAPPLQGVIALAPSIGKVGVSPLRLFIGKMLSRVWPRFTMNTGLKSIPGSRDEKVVAAIAQDEFKHTLGTARLSTEFFATRDWIYAHAGDWQVPLLILQGGADQVAKPAGSQAFYQKVSYPDKLLIEYPEAYHELHADLNYQEVMTNLGNWLDQHLPSEVVQLESMMSNE
ncbi:alpha/beta hydrolase [Cylindrospermum sp. FACHB-282]|uniref:alpha/beta hydrolase n=1 Tax=Cylindrospermum sp. FACHB-282 TaxID=2692794 RepID=UPI0016844887|nr:alpha/beta hydrolase [Cylindrospermum sp. FACHB-282]MBD2385565.1 lysophospholipase [Cylindrospermum sp. FACHB-282]